MHLAALIPEYRSGADDGGFGISGGCEAANFLLATAAISSGETIFAEHWAAQYNEEIWHVKGGIYELTVLKETH